MSAGKPSSRDQAALTRAIDAHRRRVRRRHRVRNAEGLVTLVDDLGFCFAFTRRPGDAEIPACFDHLSTTDEGRKWEWMWPWKDDLPAERRVAYGTYLVRKPTFVSMGFLPTFYATFGRAGEVDEHLEDVRSGRVSDIGRRVIEFLAQRGETQTKRMRSELGIDSKEGKAIYDKAIDELQRLMYVARVRAVGDGRENYNYTYDLFVRRYPEAVKAAEQLTSAEASTALLLRALELAGAFSAKQAAKLFDWEADQVERAAARLASTGKLTRRGSGRDEVLVLGELG